jgi:CRP-like cAMP-binding protein/cytochrome P450/bacterioferritin-associated ferredoxin
MESLSLESVGAKSDFDQSIIDRCPPIAALEPEERQRVSCATSILSIAPDTDIIVQGSIGEYFFVLLQGNADVRKQRDDGSWLRLATLGPGTYFGEQALLGRSQGHHSATVRSIGECRVARVPKCVFCSIVASKPINHELFEADAANYVYTEIARSLESFLAIDSEESSQSGNERSGNQRPGNQRLFRPGETVFAQGDPSTCAYLMLSGVALVSQQRGDEHRSISRLGAGQIFGELGVLNGAPRAATVIAETDVEVLRIEEDRFRSWYQSNSQLSGFFDSLSQVYSLSNGRRLCTFMGDVGGERAISTLLGNPTSGVVSTRVAGRGVVVFANAAAASIKGPRESVIYQNGPLKRELRVIVKERQNGTISRCIIHGLSAEGVASDLSTLYRHVLELDEATAVEIRRFQRTGFLGGEAHQTDRICPCLNVGFAELQGAVVDLGSSFENLQTVMGIGSVCGGCEAAIRSRLLTDETSARAPQSPRANDIPPNAAPIPEAEIPLSDQEQRLVRLLGKWDEDGDGYVPRTEIAIRLRGLDVQDPESFIDSLFPVDLPADKPVPLTLLAKALSNGFGYSRARRTRRQPGSFEKACWRVARAVFRTGRIGAGIAAALVLGLVSALTISLSLWNPLAGAAAVVAALIAVVSGVYSPQMRFYFFLFRFGPTNFYRALLAALGKERRYATFRRWVLFGNKTFVLRDESLIAHVLNKTDVYTRDSWELRNYAPFGSYSILGGGTDGLWLCHRMLCEEYFVDGYRADLDQITNIVRERVATWPGRENFCLLDEIYRIALEVRARIFFQTTFHCFDDDAEIDFAALIDRVLSYSFLFLHDEGKKDVSVLRGRALAAVRGSRSPGSVGGILKAGLETGDLHELEVTDNAVLYILAQAPTMAIFWTLYRSVRDATEQTLRGDSREIVRSLKEELRLHPPVTSMFRRRACQDDVLDGLEVPRNSELFLCPLYVHTNPAHWNQPEVFSSRRWTSLTGDATEIAESRTDEKDEHSRPQPIQPGQQTGRYLPFGGGPHKCQGRWFAADEMLIVVKNVLEMVDLKIVDDGNLLSQPIASQIVMHVYNRPARDVVMHATRR